MQNGGSGSVRWAMRSHGTRSLLVAGMFFVGLVVHVVGASPPPVTLDAWVSTLADLHARYHALLATAAEEPNPVQARTLRAEATRAREQYEVLFASQEMRPDEPSLKGMMVEALITGFGEIDRGGGLIHAPQALAYGRPIWTDAGLSADVLHVTAVPDFTDLPLPSPTLWGGEPNPDTIVIPEGVRPAPAFADLEAESVQPRRAGTRLHLRLFVTSVEVSPIEQPFFSVRLLGLYSGVFLDRREAETSIPPITGRLLAAHRDSLREQMFEDVLRADEVFAREIIGHLAVAGHESVTGDGIMDQLNDAPSNGLIVTVSDTQPVGAPEGQPGSVAARRWPPVLPPSEADAVGTWFDQKLVTQLSRIEFFLGDATVVPDADPMASVWGNLPLTRTTAVVRQAGVQDAVWTTRVGISGLESLPDWGGHYRATHDFESVPPPTAEMKKLRLATWRLSPDGEVFAMRRFGDLDIAVGNFPRDGKMVHFMSSAGDREPWTPMASEVSASGPAAGWSRVAWLVEHEGTPIVIRAAMEVAGRPNQRTWAARFVDGVWRPMSMPAFMSGGDISWSAVTAVAVGEDGVYVVLHDRQWGTSSDVSPIKGSRVVRWSNGRWSTPGIGDLPGRAGSLVIGDRKFLTVQQLVRNRLDGHQVSAMVPWTMADDGVWTQLGFDRDIHAVALLGEDVFGLSRSGVVRLSGDEWRDFDLPGEFALLEATDATVLPSGRVFGRGRLVHRNTGRPINGLFEVTADGIVFIAESDAYAADSNYQMPRIARADSSWAVAEMGEIVYVSNQRGNGRAYMIPYDVETIPLGERPPPGRFTLVDRRHARSAGALEASRARLMDQLRAEAVRRAWSLVRAQ